MSKPLDAATLAALRDRAPNAKNGTYTVSHPQRGHFTVKLWTSQRGSLVGQRLISLLVGPNNETDFKAVARWHDEAKRVDVWARYRDAASVMSINGYNWQRRGWSFYEQKLAIWADLVIRGADEQRHGYWWGEGYRLMLEGRCCVCNRKLTHPESIESGIGPECARKA